MNTNNSNANSKIAINSTFIRLSIGAVGIGEVVAKRRAERAAALGRGRSDARPDIAGFSDPFGANFFH